MILILDVIQSQKESSNKCTASDVFNIIMLVLNLGVVIFFTLFTFYRENNQNKYLSKSRWFQEVFILKRDITEYYNNLHNLIKRIEKNDKKATIEDTRQVSEYYVKFTDNTLKFLQVLDGRFFSDILIFSENFSDHLATLISKTAINIDELVKLINSNEIDFYKRIYSFDVENKFNKSKN